MTAASDPASNGLAAAEAKHLELARDLALQAQRAEAAHEWEQAIELLTRALDELAEEQSREEEEEGISSAPSRSTPVGLFLRSLLDRRAESRRMQGDLPGAVADLEALAQLAAEQGDQVARGLADLCRADVLVSIGAAEQARLVAEALGA